MPELGRTTPCDDCPWRVTSRPGWLGADTPGHFLWASYTGETEMPCHTQIDYSDPDWTETQLPTVDFCAGGLIFFKNTMKRPRRPKIAEAVDAVKASKAVFANTWDFICHHMPRASEEQRKSADNWGMGDPREYPDSLDG